MAEPDAALEIETFTPEECGWTPRADLGANVYERPDGKFYVFAPRTQHLIHKYQGIVPNWSGRNGRT